MKTCLSATEIREYMIDVLGMYTECGEWDDREVMEAWYNLSSRQQNEAMEYSAA